MSRFIKLVIGMSFLTIALFIVGIVSMLASFAKQDMCQHTEQYKLIDSGDYYSCLTEIR